VSDLFLPAVAVRTETAKDVLGGETVSAVENVQNAKVLIDAYDP